MFDSLERRQLLASVSSVFADGLVRITGDGGNDVVTVERTGTSTIRITSNNGGTATDLTIGVVRKISFAGLGGNDLISVGKVPVKLYLNGGAGDDSLSGSQSNVSDTILGGDGTDYVFGGGGNDSLEGNAGADVILGGAGDDLILPKSEFLTDDTVYGGTGNDTVSFVGYSTETVVIVGDPTGDPSIVIDSVAGDVETIIGGSGNDTITNITGHALRVEGGAGNDILRTGRGRDTLIGGAGSDVLDGGRDGDLFDTADGEADTITGGLGSDSATVDGLDTVSEVEVQIPTT